MIQILPLADILYRDVFFEDNFTNNANNWELANNKNEYAFIGNGYYWMENRSKRNWMFYHRKLPVRKTDNFIISAEIELVNNSFGYGQFGLVWGFNKAHNMLNKFTVSYNQNNFTVARFQKDHLSVSHRFGSTFFRRENHQDKQFFSIVKLGDYYYFYLNPYGQPVYISHVSHFSMEGERFGFYVEPGIMIRCKQVTVKRFILNPDFTGQVWMPMDKDHLPLGSEILRGN